MEGDFRPRPYRVDWIDAAKGIGISLVFYGHFLQCAIDAANRSAASQLQFIYSFHMPLFFVLAGFMFKPNPAIGARFVTLAARRLLPVVFFGLLLTPLWLFGEVRHGLNVGHDFGGVAHEYLLGRPALDWLTWFLVCLFVCESLALVTLNRISSTLGSVAFGLVCLVVGVVFSEQSFSPAMGELYTVGRTWFLSEAIVALGFFAIGRAVFPAVKLLGARPVLAAGVFAVGTAIVALTFSRNHDASGPVVVMMASRHHGDLLWFVLTALSGSTAAVALGAVVSNFTWLRFLGGNSLALLGLNGLFFHYIDPRIEQFWHVGDSALAVTGSALIATILSLLVCVPAVYLLNRFVPQLIGRPEVTGPWLPALLGKRGGSAAVSVRAERPAT